MVMLIDHHFLLQLLLLLRVPSIPSRLLIYLRFQCAILISLSVFLLFEQLLLAKRGH